MRNLSTNFFLGKAKASLLFVAFALLSTNLSATILDFNASINDCTVKISWRTTVSNDIVHYEVQKSTNNASFETINTVRPGSGEYVVSTRQSQREVAYRVVEVFRAGYGDVSDVKWVKSSCAFYAGPNVGVSLQPNPISRGIYSAFELKFNNEVEASTMSYSITDPTGRVVDSGAQNIHPGRNVSRIEMTKLAPGVFFIITSFDGIPGEAKKFILTE